MRELEATWTMTRDPVAAWMVVVLISEGDGLAGWEEAAGGGHELLLWC